MAENYLMYAFQKISEALANCDWFGGKDAPTIFVVYAHDNAHIGEAYGEVAQALIKFLKEIRARVLSDRSPTFRLPQDSRDEGTAAAHDILSNQFCLLPPITPFRSYGPISSVDKVIVCCSEVLEQYQLDNRMKAYIEEIKITYFTARKRGDSWETIKERIREIENAYRGDKSFHHVVTELAFLDIRSQEMGAESIIPIVFNGNGISYLPYWSNREPIFLKTHITKATSFMFQKLHELYFKVLYRIYEARSGDIQEFGNCYANCAETMAAAKSTNPLDENDVPPQTRIANIVEVEIGKAIARLNSHGLAAQRVKSKDYKSFLKQLHFPEMVVRENQIHDAESDSCNWITEHEAYIHWRRKNGGVLGIRGKPGAGKSTLTKKIFNLLSGMGKGQNVVIGFFYHRRGTAIQYSLVGMYRTLLYRLLEQLPEAGQEFWELADEKQKLQQWDDKNKDVVVDWSSGELRQALTKALLHASKLRSIKIVVDALDEAGNSKSQEIILYLRKINKDLLSSGGRVSICFSCRHYPVIAPDEGFEICVEHHNTEDISRDVSWKLEHLIDCRGPLDKKLQVLKKLHSIIMEKASNIFMWVVLVVPLVARWFNDGKSLKKIEASLSNVPEDLNEVYQHIITKVIDQSELQQSLLLIQWIFFAEEPLSLADMRYALASGDAAIHEGQKSCEDSEDFIDSDERMHKLIISLTGGLAEVIRARGIEKIQFVHQSVNDYLLQDQFRSLQAVNSNNFIGEAHDRLCRSCTNYIRLERTNINDKIIDREFKNPTPFCRYAVRHWGTHANKAELNNVAQRNLVDQFDWPESSDLGIWKTFLKAYKSLAGGYSGSGIYINCGSEYESIDHTSLLEVVSALHLKSTLEELVRRGQSLEKRNSNNKTVLHVAAERDDHLAAEMLLQAGADPSSTYMMGKDCTNALSASIIGGRSVRMVKLLLDAGADVNQQGEPYGTALQAAACDSSVGVMQMLLDAGADVNQQGGTYGSALQVATRYCDIGVVQMFLDAGANVNQQGGPYGTALQAAARDNNVGVVQLLLDAGANVNQQGGTYGNALQAAARYCDIGVVQMLLDAGANVNQQGGSYGTALQAAACDSSVGVVQLLLDAGANVNQQGGIYGNALQAAARYCDIGVVQLLLDAGADVNQQGGTYGNALQAAVCDNNVGVVQLLLDAGADVNQQGGTYHTALQAAVRNSNFSVVQMLLNAAADVNQQKGTDSNALQAAARFSNIGIVQLLLDAGADVNQQGGDYGTSLQAAAYRNYVKMVELLLNFGANANARGGNYGSALEAAKRNIRTWESGSKHQKNGEIKKAEAIVKLLLGAGAEDTN